MLMTAAQRCCSHHVQFLSHGQLCYPNVSVIMAYGSTPYVGMAPKKKAATLKVHK